MKKRRLIDLSKEAFQILRLFQKPLRDNLPPRISKNLFEDLELSKFLNRFFEHPEKYLTCDPEIIRERNEICASLLRNEPLFQALQNFHDTSQPLLKTSSNETSEPIQIVRNMIGVKLFYDAASALARVIDDSPNPLYVFTSLSGEIKELLRKRYPLDFMNLWDLYANGVEKTFSMSYKIRFTSDLAIDAVALTSVNHRRYKKTTLINYVKNVSEPMRVDSILSLIPGSQPEEGRLTNRYGEPGVLARFSYSIRQMLAAQTIVSENQLTIMEKGIADDIREFINELYFALGMAKYAKTITACPYRTCFAEIRDSKERLLFIRHMIHPVLAEREGIVANDIEIGNGHELILLGGLNRGGKTVFLRTAGSAQLLFQIGLPIPAESAKISPASGIFSVFSKNEDNEIYQGKLERELTEMRDIVSLLDADSLFLGNEPITGTSPKESYFLSLESLCLLKAKRARGIWISHLYALFDDVERLDGLGFGSRFICMRTDSASAFEKRNFLIVRGVPEKYSGAKEVYAQQ